MTFPPHIGVFAKFELPRAAGSALSLAALIRALPGGIDKGQFDEIDLRHHRFLSARIRRLGDVFPHYSHCDAFAGDRHGDAGWHHISNCWQIQQSGTVQGGRNQAF
jgi:hypothetical protein